MKNKNIILILTSLLFLSSCGNKPIKDDPVEPVDPETCTHEKVRFDEEEEPTSEHDGYTSGHTCELCNKKLDGYDVIKWKQTTINSSNNIKNLVNNNIVKFDVDGLSFQAGNISRSDTFLTFDYHATFVNLTPVYKIKNISFAISGTYKELYLTFGDYAMPIENQVKSSGLEYQISLDVHYSYFAISNHNRTNVFMDTFSITYYTLEKEIEQIKLPTVDIITDNGASVDSKEIYTNGKVTIKDPNNNQYDIESAAAGIRLRGNSTFSAPKKPYRIKFDKKQSVFGLTKAKNWVLLAEWFDSSNMHNFIAQSIVGLLPDQKVVFHPYHVVVTLNGVYQGLYVLIENPDEKEGRVNIEQEITIDTKVSDIMYMIEYDGRAMEEGIENINYICVKENQYYEIKYPEIDEFPDYNSSTNSSNLFSSFVTYLKNTLNNAWDAFNSKNLITIKSLFDLDSMYNQAILDLFADERDHSWLSVKLFKDSSGKICFGPCWDYDITAFGHIWTGSYFTNPYDDSVTPIYYPANSWLKTIASEIEETKIEFKARFKAFFEENLTKIIDIYYQELSKITLEMIKDAALWKEDNVSILFENIRYLDHYLSTRYQDVIKRI